MKKELLKHMNKNEAGQATFTVSGKTRKEMRIGLAKDNALGLDTITIDMPKELKGNISVGSKVTIIEEAGSFTFNVQAGQVAQESQTKSSTPASVQMRR